MSQRGSGGCFTRGPVCGELSLTDRLKLAVFLAAGLLAAPALAWAQTGEPGEAGDGVIVLEHDPYRFDRIFVTDSAGGLITRTPASLTLLPGETVEAQKALRIGELLANVPGVFASGLNGPREIVQIRQPLAFDNRVLFLEDGVPLQSSIFFDQSALGYSQVLTSPGGIEVLRGPGTALYGSDAQSGVVNIRTRAPDTGPALGARIRGGEDGLFDLQMEAGGELQDLRGRDNALRGSFAFNGEDGFRDETAFHRTQGVIRHLYSEGGFSAQSGIYVTDFETESATSIAFADFSAGRITGSGLNPAVDPEKAVETGTLIRAQSRLAYNGSGNFAFEATPYWRRQESDATLTFQPATTPRESAVIETFGLLPRAVFTDAGDGRTTIGVDLELSELNLQLFQSRPDAVVFGDLFRQGAQFDYTVDYRAISPYLQHTRSLGDVTLVLGLRHDDLRYDFDNRLDEMPGDARLQVADRIDRFDALSPKASILWDVAEGQTLFARYARGFRVPRASELYELEAGQAEFTLKPERLDSFELGWRGNWDGLRGELVGYWQDSENGVITDVQTSAGNISISAGERRFAGIEASLAADLGAGLEARAVFAWQDFTFERRSADGPDPFDGNALPEAPETLANLVITWTPPAAEDFTFIVRARHIGAWPMNDANTLFTDDEYLFGLQGEWRLSDHLLAEVRIENVTDENYAVFADAPAFAPNGRARPGAPRTVSAGVKIRY